MNGGIPKRKKAKKKMVTERRTEFKVLKPLKRIIAESPFAKSPHTSESVLFKNGSRIRIHHKSSRGNISGCKLSVRSECRHLFDGVTPHKCVLSEKKNNREIWKVFPADFEIKRYYSKSFPVYETWFLDESEQILSNELFEI